MGGDNDYGGSDWGGDWGGCAGNILQMVACGLIESDLNDRDGPSYRSYRTKKDRQPCCPEFHFVRILSLRYNR